MTTRKYSSRSQQTTLTSAITSGDLTMLVGNGSNLLATVNFSVAGTFTVVIDPDTALEEIVDVTARSSNTLTISRGIDGSTAVAHSAGAIVRHMVIGRDLQEANTHIESPLGAHAATTSANLASIISDETGSGSLVFGTSPTIATATLTTPTMSAPIMTGTATAANLTASGTVTAALFSGPLTGAVTGNVTGNLTGNVTGSASLNLLKSGDTMSGAIAMGANKITGLGTPTANTTDAANTAYVDTAITTAITNVIASAPALLDTLDELAAALGDDANFATTVTTNLAAKANIASPTFTGVPAAPTASVNTNTTQIATTAYVMAATVAPSNLTGPITSSGSATSIASQTGTGTKFVVDTSPTLVTPVLGVATATSINGTTIPSSVTLVKTGDTLATLSATTSAQLAGVISDETGSGALVFGTSPTLTTPVLGSATGTSLGLTVASGTTVPLTIQNNGTGNSFVVNDDASDTTPFVIDAAGNVGIGASSPSNKLDVTAVTGVVNVSSSIGTNHAKVQVNNTGGSFQFGIENSAGNNFGVTAYSRILWNDGAHPLVFTTSSTERMRIDSSGNTTINAIAAGTTTTGAVGGGYMGMPQNSATTGAYGVVAADAGKHIYSTATRTVTIPANGTIALPIGTTITFIATTGATVTIAITTDTMYLAGTGTTGSRTLAAHGMATAVKVAATTWYISGNGLT